MADIDFVPLSTIKEEKLMALMTNPLVRQHMPLLRPDFSVEDCRAFVAAKTRLWEEHGYGPWAFLIGDQFAGWGGLQPEGGDADFALVLHPDFWGWGRRIFTHTLDWASDNLGETPITILLPPGRPNTKAVTRFGFTPGGALTIAGETFLRFRREAQQA